jgi:PHP family Zn ribbon phosphoesterase
MKIIADFHIHSKYSRATSRDMDLEHINEMAKIKGIKVLTTSDFTHPEWLQNLKEKLEPAEIGLFKLKNGNSPTRFILTTEISCIYSKKGRVRKIHILIFAPSFEIVDKINVHLGWIGNLKADGRPILGLDAKELAKIVLNISEDCLVVPAHLYTPWFSLFGSRSGFDSIEECFEDYSKYIYAGETGLSCYDKKTEVLTNDGWKNFSEINYDDKICTLNTRTDQIEFQKPTGKFAYKYKGKMYRLRTKRVDLLVTPNHKLFVKLGDPRNLKPFALKETRFLFSKSKQFKKDGVWIGKNEKYFTLPTVKIRHGSRYHKGFRNKKEKQILMKSWLKFFGLWIAEGCTNKGKNGDYNIFLSNQNKKLLFEMKKILKNIGCNVYQDDKKIRVRDYQLFYYLKQFGKCSDKFVPPEIKSLSKELLEIFLKYYIKGDGCIYGRNGKGLSATTSSVRLRDDLQEIALKIGISAYYKLDRKKGTPFRGIIYKNKTYKQKHDTWTVFFIRKNNHTVYPSMIKRQNHIESWVNFNDQVFCVTVPNHIIYVRRNGIPVWCGNSDPLMSWRNSSLDKITLISNSDAHSAAKIGREANVFDTELNYPSIIEAIKQKDPQKFLYTIEFFPEEGKYHYDGHRLCKVSMSPEQRKKVKGICPECGRKLTVGVLSRVDELADRKEGFVPPGAIPYKSLVPLKEIIAEAVGVGTQTKSVDEQYQILIQKFSNEFNILLDVSLEELNKFTLPKIAEGIKRVRDGKLIIEPGYDGEFGKVRIFQEGEKETVSQDKLF